MFQNEWKKREYTKPTQCSASLFFLPRWFLSLHKNRYSIINNCLVVFLRVTQLLILVSRKLFKNFILIFVSTLRNHELGNMKNWEELGIEFILYIGSKLCSGRSYKTEKMATVLQSVHTEMCSLAVFYDAFVSLEGVTETTETL